jgi:hypothetical protein
MRYKTVKDVIEFVGNLKAKDTADSQLQIHVEFYHEGDFVGELVKNMYSEYTSKALIGEYLLDYFVTDFKIEMREYCIAFVLSIKKPSSI